MDTATTRLYWLNVLRREVPGITRDDAAHNLGVTTATMNFIAALQRRRRLYDIPADHDQGMIDAIIAVMRTHDPKTFPQHALDFHRLHIRDLPEETLADEDVEPPTQLLDVVLSVWNTELEQDRDERVDLMFITGKSDTLEQTDQIRIGAWYEDDWGNRVSTDTSSKGSYTLTYSILLDGYDADDESDSDLEYGVSLSEHRERAKIGLRPFRDALSAMKRASTDAGDPSPALRATFILTLAIMPPHHTTTRHMLGCHTRYEISFTPPPRHISSSSLSASTTTPSSDSSFTVTAGTADGGTVSGEDGGSSMEEETGVGEEVISVPAPAAPESKSNAVINKRE